MTCERYPDPIDAERYVSGEMTEPEQSAFEEHFFSCDVCFQRVRELQLVQAALPAWYRHATGPASLHGLAGGTLGGSRARDRRRGVARVVQDQRTSGVSTRRFRRDWSATRGERRAEPARTPAGLR